MFMIGHGYLAVWVLMFIMTADGLFAIRLDFANLNITLSCNQKLYEYQYNFPE
jgi:hypothetical protein